MNPGGLRFLLFVVFMLLCLSLSSTHAQENRVLAELSKTSTVEKPVILIKWYSRDLVYKEGVNLYRRKAGTLTWDKINQSPIRIKSGPVPPSTLSNDPDLEEFVYIIRNATPKELQEDMLFVNVLIKSFQSNVFADIMGIYYEDSGVQSGESYEYRVNRIQKGQEYLVGVSLPIAAGPYAPTPPITDVEVYQKGKTLNINWKHEEERYYAVNIYRKSNTDEAPTKLNTNPILLTEVRDSLGNMAYPKPMFSENVRLEEGKTYTYQLAGVGFFGNETEWSAPAEAYFKDVTPPPPPKNLEGKADSMKVHLRWENAPVDDLDGMNINRSMKSDGPFEIVNNRKLSIPEITFSDSLTVPGPYYYYVSAIDKAGNEAHSNLIFVEVQDVVPPAQPKELTMKTDTGKVFLSWKSNTEPDLAGYYLYRTVDKNNRKNYVLLNAEPVRENHFEQRLPKNVKNEFFYFVVAVDTSYNRSIPSEHVSGAMPDILPPEKPFIKNISYQDENIVVEWVRNVDSDLAGYHLFRSDTSRNFAQVNLNPLGRETFRYIDRTSQPNIDYFYYLEAFDSAGNVSPTSKEVYARRIVKDLPQVGNITLKIKRNKRKKQNALRWDYEADPQLVGFIVFRGEQENRLKPITGVIKSKTFTDKNTRSTETQEVYYQIRAYVGSGVVYSSVIKQKL